MLDNLHIFVQIFEGIVVRMNNNLDLEEPGRNELNTDNTVDQRIFKETWKVCKYCNMSSIHSTLLSLTQGTIAKCIRLIGR